MTETQHDDQNLRCMAVDDEPFALKLLADDIAKVPFLSLTATCSSATEALEVLKSNSIDLLFLDIQMPLVTGIQFLKSLNNPPLVIITTAYEQYALDGFELNVIDYLVKPIPFERFMKAVKRTYDQFVLEKAHAPMDSFFFVHSEYKEIKVLFDDVLCVEGLKDYVKIFLKSQRHAILTRLNLKAMESKLPVDRFCRIHNSFIVSLTKISSIQKSQVFIGERSIPIGDKYAEAFQTRYKSTT